MSNENCILTTKDFTIIEVMRDRCLGRDDPLAPLLERKMESAHVVFRDDVPENVATLSSRITFSADGRIPDTRVLSHAPMTSPVGMFLPITTERGLALLGLTEGQEFRWMTGEGSEASITLEKVLYQPEAARRAKEKNEASAVARDGPTLKLIRGAFREEPRQGGFDDPGPSAA